MRSKIFLAGMMAGALLATPAFAQNLNIRGTIASFESSTLQIDSFDGRRVAVDVPADLRVATTKPFSLSEVKPGMKLGVTTVKAPDGRTIAIDVRPISATARCRQRNGGRQTA